MYASVGAAPCANVFAGQPGTIAVGSFDIFDSRTVSSAFDYGNRSCIDIWSPGGGLGNAIAGASSGK